MPQLNTSRIWRFISTKEETVGSLVDLFIQNFSGSVNNVPTEKCSNKSVTTKIVRLAFFRYISHEAVVGYVSCVILDLLSQAKDRTVAQSVLPTRYQIKIKPNV